MNHAWTREARPDDKRPSRRQVPIYSGVAIATLCVSLAGFLAPAAAARPTRVATGNATVDTSAPSSCLNPASTMLVPTPGFDPLTASDTELQARDFPPRPNGTADLAIWQRYAQKYLSGQVASCLSMPADAPPPLPNLPKNFGANSNWAGWGVASPTLTDSDSHFFVQPATGATTDEAAFWTGVDQGFSNADPLIQGGVVVFPKGVCLEWSEAYPLNTPDYFAVCNPNDDIYVHVTMSAGNGLASWHIVDMTANPPNDYRVSHSYFAAPDGTAETIVEKVGAQPLANFGTPEELDIANVRALLRSAS
jgi:hypothetical protein